MSTKIARKIILEYDGYRTQNSALEIIVLLKINYSIISFNKPTLCSAQVLVPEPILSACQYLPCQRNALTT